MLGPGNAPAATPVLLVLGDATAIGLAIALRPHFDSRPVTGAIEVHPDDAGAAAELLPGMEILRAATPGTAISDWLRDRPAVRPAAFAEVIDQPGIALLLAGHAQTCIAMRGILRDRGIPRRLIRTHAYWADGKSGL
jgi:NADPH-dependent ferric siderophore reductase